jgi:hypothetical protein
VVALSTNPKGFEFVMSDIKQRLTKLKYKTFTSNKLNLMNAVMFDRRIDPYTKLVFNALKWFQNAKTGQCNPSDTLIASLIGFGNRSRVANSRAKLRAYGYIHWRKSTTSNFYTFNDAAAKPILAFVGRMLEARRETRQNQQPARPRAARTREHLLHGSEHTNYLKETPDLEVDEEGTSGAVAFKPDDAPSLSILSLLRGGSSKLH